MSTRSRTSALALLLAGVLLLVGGFSHVFRADFAGWSSRIHDALFTLRAERGAPLPANPNLVFIDIDDKSYEVAGNASFGRASFARLLRVLKNVGVRAAVFDVAFVGATDPAHDAALLAAVKDYGAAYMPLIVAIDPPGSPERAAPAPLAAAGSPWVKEARVIDWGRIRHARSFVGSLPGLDSAAAGVGHITTYPDRDGVYRKMRLVLRDGDLVIPALAVRVAMDLLNVPPGGLTIEAGRFLTLSGKGGEVRIPIDEEGCAVVNLAGKWDEVFPHFSAYKLLEAEKSQAAQDQLAEALEGAVAVISDPSTRSQDFGTTPLEKIYPKGGLHLNLLNGILTANLITEAGAVWALSLSLAAALVLWAAGSYLSVALFGVVSALLLVMLGGGAVTLFFRQAVLFPVMEPALTIVAGALTVLVARYFWAERDRAVLRMSFESYLPGPVLDKVLKSPDLLSTVQRKTLTILFSDIAGFTKWCSTQTPSAIHSTLNDYFREMTEIVFAHGGTVDKYIGDGLMVFFGDPIDQPDHAVRAVKCAVAMQLRCRELRELWGARGGLPVRIRVGVNTGEVAVGNMGSRTRMDYTVIGADVNLSQRLEANAPVDSVLMSEATRGLVEREIAVKFYREIIVKGYDTAINTYEIDWGPSGRPS